MNRKKMFSAILRQNSVRNLYLFGILICLLHVPMTSSQIIHLTDINDAPMQEVHRSLVKRQTSVDDDELPTCMYRNMALSQEDFGVWADYGCYTFTRPDLMVNGLLPIMGCNFNGVILPVLNVTNNCQYKFSSHDPTVEQAVRSSFGNNVNVINRWLNCCQDAMDCCTNDLLGRKAKHNHCPPVWDGWTCFSEYTRAGEDEEMVCPKYAYSGTPPQCNHYSKKTCFHNATWMDQTNYTGCAISPRIVTRTKWHISMLSISIILCLPGLIILLVYKQLYTQKYNMIRNLIIAILLRNVLVLISKSTIIMDELTNTNTTTIMANNGAGCRILTFSEKLAANFVFTCMLLEGIYLHQLLTNVFSTRRNAGMVKMLYYYIGGIAISTITAVVWAILMAVNYDINCWTVTDGNNLHWINDSPRLAMLLVNIILLGHIVVVMWKTFRSKSNEDKPGLRTAKASLICLPLFGVPFLFIIFRPVTESCGWEQFYYFVSYALEGLQGIFVVIFHCYLDREVLRLLKRSFNVIREHLNIRSGTAKKRESKSENRRTTFSTYADSQPNASRLSNNRPVIGSPIIANSDDKLPLPNTLAPANVSIMQLPNFKGSPAETTAETSETNNEPIYENIPRNGIPRCELKEHQDPKSKHILLWGDNKANSNDQFYINNDNENIFDYYYNDGIDKTSTDNSQQPGTNSSQMLPPTDCKDDRFNDKPKLDPQLFFKNRADGIQFLDDDNQY